MLKIYTITRYYQLDGQDIWFKVGGTSEVLEDRDGLSNEEVIFDAWSWQELIDYFKEHNLYGFDVGQTLFRKYLYLRCYDADDLYGLGANFCQGDFETLTYKRVYTEDKNVSLDHIMKRFPAEQCMQYMKERGLVMCPLNNTK